MKKAIIFGRSQYVGIVVVFMLLLRIRSKFSLQVVEHVSFFKMVAIVIAANSFNLSVVKIFSYHWSSSCNSDEKYHPPAYSWCPSEVVGIMV